MDVVRGETSNRPTYVVTADRELQDQVTALGAQVLAGRAADRVVVRRPARHIKREGAGDGLESAVAGEDRVVIELDDAQVEPAAETHVEAAAELQGKAGLAVVCKEIEFRKEINTLALPVGISFLTRDHTRTLCMLVYFILTGYHTRILCLLVYRS